MSETTQLKVQANGMIVVETTGRGFVKTTGARNLQYVLEWLATNGIWQRLSGTFDDERKAREALEDTNRHINWRLVAFNEQGEVALPKKWSGFYG